jgi:hypothetical protein
MLFRENQVLPIIALVGGTLFGGAIAFRTGLLYALHAALLRLGLRRRWFDLDIPRRRV